MNLFHRWPLAIRLGLLFGVVAGVVSGVANVHMSASLADRLRSREDERLLAAVEDLRHALRQFDGAEAIRRSPHRLFSALRNSQDLLLAVKDSQGEVIAANSRDAEVLATTSPLPQGQGNDGNVIRGWGDANGDHGRMIAAWGQTAQGPDGRALLIVARRSTENDALLKKHRDDAWWVTLAVVLATALLGYMVTLWVLRPVRAMARAATRITTSQLGERLRIDDAPGEIKAIMSSFNSMLDRLEDSFRRLTQFSSDIAHDLRTPINNLMVGTQTVLMKQRSIPEYEALLASNVEEYERLTRMIDNLLFLAQADNAEVVLHKETIFANVELKRIAEYFEGTAEENGVLLEVDASGYVVADAILFRRAVNNLVMNALQHTPRGERITIRGHARGSGEFVVEVSNPGSGIPPEHMERIFDRFYRVDASRKNSSSSSGLGLAIVKSIMNLHGGSAQVESVPNGHTTFRLRFPAVQAEEALRKRPKSRSSENPGSARAARR